MTTYYVSTTGSDSANGSAASPFKSIDFAVGKVNAGDTVIVKAGIYKESVTIDRDGTASAYVTIKSEVPGGAIINPPGGGANGITIRANYVTVDGFEVYGSGSHGIVGFDSHHVIVSNNISHDNQASGVAFAWSDYITIDGNVTYGNASSGWFSGISLYQNRNITGNTSTDGFRNVISNNISYDNVTETGAHTDGNGIIIDDFQSTQTSGYPNYTFKTLVENNLVYENGGKGIQVTWSDYVTVRGNTAYHNNQDLQNTGTWRGEISNAQSSNNTFINNIAVSDPTINKNNTAIDNVSYGGYVNANIVWANNLTYNGTAGAASIRTEGSNATLTTANKNLLGVDPGFVNAAADNFTLKAGSVAVNAGTSNYGLPSTDLAGHTRAVGVVDLGAYEYAAAAAPNSAPVAKDDTGLTTQTNTALTIASSTLLANDTDADGNKLSITGVSAATNGTVKLDATGNVIFTPTASFSGTAGFTYAISDGSGGTGTAKVVVAVQSVNHAPVAQDDTGLTGISGTPKTILATTLLANDTDSDGNTLKLASVQSATNGTASLDQSGNVVFTPNVGFTGTAKFEYTVSDGVGGTDTGLVSVTVAAPAVASTFTLWNSSALPAVIAEPDNRGVNLGLKFVADVAADLKSIEFYKSSLDTGVKSVSVWSTEGTLLATQNVSGLSDSGWQKVDLGAPVHLLAGKGYIVSYYTSTGYYSVTEGFFSKGYDAGAITLGANAGVYGYGNTSALPTAAYNGSNYWIDVVLDTGAKTTVGTTHKVTVSSGVQTITNFVDGDKIDISAVDANRTLAGVQDFTYIGSAALHNAGDLHVHSNTATNKTYIQGDTNGNGLWDFSVVLNGVHTLAQSDFIF